MLMAYLLSRIRNVGVETSDCASKKIFLGKVIIIKIVHIHFNIVKIKDLLIRYKPWIACILSMNLGPRSDMV